VYRRPRDFYRGRGVFVLSALVVTIVVIVGVVIAGQNDSPSAPPTHPAATKSAPTVQPAASIKPVQRLSGTASTFDSGSGGWTGNTASVAGAAAPAHQGAGALKVSGSNPAGGSMSAWSSTAPANGGDRYVGTAYVRAVTAVRGAEAELRFIASDGTVTDTETGQQATDSLRTWKALPRAVGIAPKGTTQVQLGVHFPVVGPGAVHLVDDATIAQTPGGSTRVVPPLRVAGSQILQGNGKPLIIRGLQRFGLEGGTKTPLPTDAEIGQLKQWGANEVRISLGEQKWIATSCHFQPDYPKQVDQVVRWVTSRGMVALINLHFSSIGHCGPAGLTPMADSPGAVTFWQAVASRYRNNPLVAFDLFNEPNVAQSIWLDGGPFVAQGKVVEAAGMQQLYDTVRGTGAQNLVVISGLDFADHPPSELVGGVNIAYGAHAYQCTDAPPPSCTTPHPYDAAVPLDHWVDFAKTTPVIVTEFGWPNGDSGTYNTNVIDFAEAHGWGWSGFAWDGGTDGLYDLVQAHPAHGDDTTIEPNAGGMPLVAGFARNTSAKPPR
jgi:hypothetical protein